MTKKDYIRIADALILGYKETDLHDRPITRKQFADIYECMSFALGGDSDKFDSVRFREYIAGKINA